MITFILAALLTLAVGAWFVILVATVRHQRKMLKVTGEFHRAVHKLCLDHAEHEPFARMVLDELRKHNDRLYEMGESKTAKTGAKGRR